MKNHFIFSILFLLLVLPLVFAVQITDENSISNGVSGVSIIQPTNPILSNTQINVSVNGSFLALDGSNANININIGAFGFTASELDIDTININGNVISDSTGIISFDNDILKTSGDINLTAGDLNFDGQNALVKFGTGTTDTITFTGQGGAVASGIIINSEVLGTNIDLIIFASTATINSNSDLTISSDGANTKVTIFSPDDIVISPGAGGNIRTADNNFFCWGSSEDACITFNTTDFRNFAQVGSPNFYWENGDNYIFDSAIIGLGNATLDGVFIDGNNITLDNLINKSSNKIKILSGVNISGNVIIGTGGATVTSIDGLTINPAGNVRAELFLTSTGGEGSTIYFGSSNVIKTAIVVAPSNPKPITAVTPPVIISLVPDLFFFFFLLLVINLYDFNAILFLSFSFKSKNSSDFIKLEILLYPSFSFHYWCYFS